MLLLQSSLDILVVRELSWPVSRASIISGVSGFFPFVVVTANHLLLSPHPASEATRPDLIPGGGGQPERGSHTGLFAYLQSIQ